jgi:Tol biopolymer transport system component
LDCTSVSVRIGDTLDYEVSPSFSSDGQRIVYAAGVPGDRADHELFISHADGTQQAQITTSANGCFHGVFDSSGKNIYFLMEEWPEGPSGVPKSSIWTVNADGSGQTQLTDLSLFDTPTGWKPQESPSPLSTSRGTSRSSRPLFKKPG